MEAVYDSISGAVTVSDGTKFNVGAGKLHLARQGLTNHGYKINTGWIVAGASRWTAEIDTVYDVDAQDSREPDQVIDYADLDRICSALRERGSEADMTLLIKLRGLRQGQNVVVTNEG